MKILKEVSKEELREFLYRQLEVEDSNLYSEVQNDNSIGIFQFGGNTAKRLIEQIKPENFDELVAVNAFARPGSIENAPLYLERKNGAKSPYPDKMNEILKDTYNTLTFQEQIMSIFHNIGGFSLSEADQVRGLMKKLGKAEKNPEDIKKWEKTVKKFKKGAVKLGIDEKSAEKITNDLAAFASYSFNKSHATAYTYVAIITLYLSYYFRKYFFSAVLSYEIDRDKELLQVMNKIRNSGIEILQPDINKSKRYISPTEENKIVFGLFDIKFVGDKPTQKIIENRPYNSLIDFIIKTRSREVSSRVIISLIKIGAFDSLINKERKKYIAIFESFWAKKGTTKVKEKIIEKWNQIEKSFENVPGLKTNNSDLISYERELLGFNFFTSKFTTEKIKAFDKMNKYNLIYWNFEDVERNPKRIPIIINNIRTHIDKNDNEMAFLTLQDITGDIKSIPVFASYWQYIKNMLEEDELYLLNVHKKEDSILFGVNYFENNELKIKRMVKKIQ